MQSSAELNDSDSLDRRLSASSAQVASLFRVSERMSARCQHQAIVASSVLSSLLASPVPILVALTTASFPTITTDVGSPSPEHSGTDITSSRGPKTSSDNALRSTVSPKVIPRLCEGDPGSVDMALLSLTGLSSDGLSHGCR